MEEFIRKGGIIRSTDYRGRKYDRCSMRFCSVLDSNLSGTAVETGGDFAGNGWIACNFFGARYAGLDVDMEQYEGCSMGGMKLVRARCREIRVKDCGFAGSFFEGVRMQDCFFEECSFRRAHFCGVVMERIVFRRCIFEQTEFCRVRASETMFCECIFYGRMPELEQGYVLQNCLFDG